MLLGITKLWFYFSLTLDLGGDIAGNAIYLLIGVALPSKAVYLFLLIVGRGVIEVVGRGVIRPGSGDSCL